MAHQIHLRTFIIRCAMVVFWIAAIILFLLVPHILESFSHKKSITVLAWPALIDTHYLKAFEKESGIKVNVRYFENNEELLAKMKETKGRGYDLIMPSDYMVDLMVQQGLLKKIDKSRLPFFNDLYPHLVGNYYDPENQYSMPFFWSIYGIAVNSEHFGGELPQASWKLVFDPRFAQPHTCMIDDARELILIAGQYLFGKQDSFNQMQIEQIKQLLVEQKKWVELYTEERANFLLMSKMSPVAVILSAIVARIARNVKRIKFLVPEEGSFMVIDSFAMPIATDKDDLVYQFLNYIYKKEVLKNYIAKYGYFAPIKSIEHTNLGIEMPSAEQFKKIDFFRNILTNQQISDIWIALKA